MGGVCSGLYAAPGSGMKPPSNSGRRGAGPRSKKKAVEEQRTLVFVDESGFSLLPAVVRTYAPVARTPVIRERLTHDHLSAISGITPEGRLYLQTREQAYKGPQVVGFLRHLLRHIPGRLLVLWDQSPIHRSGAVKEYLAGGAARRIHLELLPAYAPELNPDEGIWNHLKRVELKNLACRDVSHLRSELRKAKERLRHKRHVIRGCIAQPGLF